MGNCATCDVFAFLCVCVFSSLFVWLLVEGETVNIKKRETAVLLLSSLPRGVRTTCSRLFSFLVSLAFMERECSTFFSFTCNLQNRYKFYEILQASDFSSIRRKKGLTFFVLIIFLWENLLMDFQLLT
jgi:hypothetical protein